MKQAPHLASLRAACRNNAAFILIFSIFAVLVLQLLLKNLMTANEQQVLACARHLFDPGWIPNDWFLNQQIGYRGPFNRLVGPLTAVLPLDAVAIAGRLLVYFLFSIIIYRLARIFGIHPILMVPVAFFFATNQSLAAKEWMIGSFETKNLAYLCVLGSLIFFFDRRYPLMFILSGLAATFHVLIGLYAAICLGVSILIRFRGLKEDFPRIVKSSALFFIFAAPAILGAFSYLNEMRGVDTRFAGYIYSVVRHPHHLFPGAWAGWWHIRFAACVIFFALVALRAPDRRRRFLAVYALAGLGIFSAGIVLYFAGQYHLLKFYWFRFGDTVAPFMFFLLAACLISDFLRNTGPAASGAASPPPGMAGARKAAVIAASCVTLLTVAESILVFGLHLHVMRESTPYYLWKMDRGLVDALFWIRNSTPVNSTVLTDPFIDMFHVTAERAQFVAFKDVPQTDRNVLEWYRRMIALNNGVEPAHRGFKMQEELEHSYYSLEPATVRRLAQEYKLDYYLDKKGRKLPFRAVYENRNYILYSIR